jgi:15-cis-phytoene synthase
VIAMQLTNIARDVGEDARAGRLYLPMSWMRDAGVDPVAWLADPRFDGRVGKVVGRLLAIADNFYRRAVPGIGALPPLCRPGIHAARLIYAEIGREVERSGCDSVSRRAVVSASRKMRLLAEGLLCSVTTQRAVIDCVEPAARVLVNAVAASPPPIAATVWRSRSAIENVVWVLDLFERLERRDQLLRGGNTS